MTRAPLSSRYWIVGSAARMRVSSPTSPSLIGTLKSTRTSARFPRRSSARRSLMVFLFIASSGKASAHVAKQVDAARRIAPLVVVPAADLEQRAVDDVGALRVDDAGVRIADEVR